MAGIKREARASVENMAPNWGNVHPLAFKQYVPMVINHAPQTKNCIKLKMIRRNLILIIFFPVERKILIDH